MTKITFPHLKSNTSYKVCNYFLKARIFAFLCGAICAAWGGSLTLVKGGKKEDTPANTHKPLTYKYNYKLQITNYKLQITNYKLQITSDYFIGLSEKILRKYVR